MFQCSAISTVSTSFDFVLVSSSPLYPLPGILSTTMTSSHSPWTPSPGPAFLHQALPRPHAPPVK